MTTRALPEPDPVAEPLAFFDFAHRAFSDILADPKHAEDRVAGLMTRAFALFGQGVTPQDEALQEAACHGGCASCCTIRVGATAPEILMIARIVRGSSMPLAEALTHKIASAHEVKHRCNTGQGAAECVLCPFVEDGLCIVYPVRPLACRGHVSFDAQACIDALEGAACDVPVSTLHLTVRSLVQNALQSALRDGRRAWAMYELDHALRIATGDDACEAAWIAGVDVFAAAAIDDVSPDEMAATFDAIKTAIAQGT